MALMNFNLIASTFRYGEEDAQEELLDLLEILGDNEPESQITDINGIVVAYTNLELFQVINSLRQLVKNEPWQIRYVLRLLPIESVVHTRLEDIGSAAKNLILKMHSRDTFRITVERRHTFMSSADIIATVGRQINNKVDLKNPDWIVLIEIIGAFTGISVLKSNQIFSSVIEKRNNSQW
jgi:tRNA acetyltransferase TAN1